MTKYKAISHTIQIGIIIVILTLLFFTIYWTEDTAEPARNQFSAAEGTDAYFWDVSAYCPCELCCGEWADGITASGMPAEGFLVAAPPLIPFGTLLSIPGYNNGLPVPVLDRGGSIKGNRVDVLFATHYEALNWGRKTLTVKILKD